MYRVYIFHIWKDFDNFPSERLRPIAFLGGPIRVEPQNIKDSKGNRFFDFCKKKRQISPKWVMDYNYCILGPFWSKNFFKKKVGQKKIFGTPLPEKTGKKRPK